MPQRFDLKIVKSSSYATLILSDTIFFTGRLTLISYPIKTSGLLSFTCRTKLVKLSEGRVRTQ